MLTQQSLTNRIHTLVNKPITLYELARLIGSRWGNFEANVIFEKIQYWIHQGFYGVQLHAWKVGATQMTTLKHYQEFRQKVGQQRKKCAAKLLKHIQKVRDEEQRTTLLPFPKNRIAAIFSQLEQEWSETGS